MARGRTRKNRRNRRTRKNRRTMKGGLEIWKTSKPTWVKKDPKPNLPKLNVSNTRVSTPESSPTSSPNSSPDSSPASSPKPSVINISFAVPKKQNQKQQNTAPVVNPGSRFNLLPIKQLNAMKWF